MPCLYVACVWLINWRLAWQEERELRSEFGDDYEHYAVNTPAFFPRWVESVNKNLKIQPILPASRSLITEE